MNTNTYGLSHFKHKTNFGSIIVFSDEEKKFVPQDKTEPSTNQYINIYQDSETEQWIARITDVLSGDYGDFVIEAKDLNPLGSIEANNITFFLTEDQEPQYGDLIMDYYQIDGKLYLQVNAIVELEEVIITAKKSDKKIIAEPEEQLDAFVTVFISGDGAKLERAYQQIDDVKDRELVVFTEKDDSTNYFGSVFRVSSGKNLSNYSIYPKLELSSLLRSYTTDPSLSMSAVSDLIEEHFENKEEQSFFLWLPRLGAKFIRLTSSFTLEPLGDIMYDISAEIDKGLRLGENYWKATINGEPNEKYDPLLPGYDVLTNEKIIKKTINKINKDFVEPLAKPVAKLIRKMRRNKLIKRFLGNRLYSLLHFVESLPEYLESIITSIFEFLRNAFEFFNALLVGIINSIVDLLKSVFDILGLIFKGLNALTEIAYNAAKNPSSFLGLIVESFENVISIIASVFTFDNLKAFIGFQLFIIESVGKLGFVLIDKVVKSFTEEDDNKEEIKPVEEDEGLPYDAIGYYTGYVIGFIAQEVAIFMLTAGVGTVAKGIQGAVRSYVELGKAIGRATKATAKAAHRAGSFTIDTFLKALRALKNFAKQIPRHLETVKAWINDLIASIKAKVLLIDGVAYTFVDPISIFASTLFRAAKGGIRKAAWKQLARLGVDMRKGGDGLYALFYNGKKIEEGLTKSQAESFLKRIFSEISKKSDDFVKGYLDELVEIKNLKRVAISNINNALVDSKGFIRVFGDDFIEKYQKLIRHPKRTELITKAKKALKNDPKKQHLKYSNEATPKIPLSELGTSPTFKGMKAYLNEGKLGNGIIPKGAENYVADMKRLIRNNQGEIKTYVTGDRPSDFKNCWRAMGVKDEKLINKYQRLAQEMELTWHHLDDLDDSLQGTFQLIFTPLHQSTTPHMGSFAQLKEVFKNFIK